MPKRRVDFEEQHAFLRRTTYDFLHCAKARRVQQQDKGDLVVEGYSVELGRRQRF
jgi:hypothetical protein